VVVVAAFAAALLAAALPVAASAAVSPRPAWILDGAQDSAYLGWSVGTAGDVNGDGYSDVIVGEPYYDVVQFFLVNVGRARIFLGGPNGVSAVASWSVIGGSNSAFGYSVGTAGDVNGDGYDDVIVGAPDYSNGQNQEGGAWLYLGGPDGPDTTADWMREGGQATANLGLSVATAGDVNGDGYDDVVIGAPSLTNQYENQGRVYIFHGNAGGLAANPQITLDGTGEGDALGSAVATAGDVNGDGYADVLVSAIYYEGFIAPTDEGIVYCLHGGAGGVDGVPDWSATGIDAYELFGSSLSLAGDVNGDGFGDVVIGGPGYENGQMGEGRAVVYLGSYTGLETSPARVYEWNQQAAQVGRAVATAGDANGDGLADLAIAAPYYDDPEPSEGLVRIYGGTPNGPRATVDTELESDEAAANLGFGLATAGDVNGDGFSDLIVAAPYADAGGTNRGTVRVHFGAADAYAAASGFHFDSGQGGGEAGGSVGFADVNGDGFSDLLGSAWRYDSGEVDEGLAWCWHGSRDGLGGTAWFVMGNQDGAGLGRVIAPAGDVDGDGYDDVVVTASGWDGTVADEGQARVYHGSSGGLSTAATWTMTGGQAGGAFGHSAAAAGDVNGDGYGDLLVGMPHRSNPQVGEGAALLYLGSPSGLSPVLAGGWEGNQDGARNGWSVAGAGDVNGDGLSDMISGAPDWSNGQAGEGAVFVYFGTDGTFPPTYSQVLERNHAGAGFGTSVAPAGDVNGDGYSDIVVGAPTFSNGDTAEGSVAVYLGSASGLDPTPVFTWEGNSLQARAGEWVAPAGDVNADGYSDFVVGAPSPAGPGRVYLFRGRASGVEPTPAWWSTGGTTDEFYGRRAHGGGDVDGDGFPELAIGAPGFADGQTEEGRILLFYGNRNSTQFAVAGIPRQLHQRRADDAGPLALLGRSESANASRIRVLGRSAAGRRPIRAVWEAQPLGTTWTGAVERSPNWIDSGTPLPDGQGSRVGVNQPVTGLAAGEVYHLRLRTECDSPFFPRSPWFSVPGNAATEADFRTAEEAGSAPHAEGAAGGSARGLRLLGFEPNPVRSGAVARFSLPAAGRARLTLHDAAGRRVAALLDGEFQPGTHAVPWDGRSDGGARLAPGVYFARLEVNGAVAGTRLVVAR